MKEIVGHQRVLERLRQIANSASVAPSYLFHGPRGVGKALVAHWLAAALLCPAPLGSRPCGECSNCQRVERDIHPDLRWTSLAPGRDSIGIEEIRAGIEAVQTCSYEGGYRFWIIDEAQSLTEEAQSALLKTLEEPPSSLIMMLIAHSEGRELLPTITSRCRILEFKPLPLEPLSQHLLQLGYPNPKAQVAARIANGSLGQALELLANPQAWDRRAALLEILGRIAKASLWERLEAATTLEKLSLEAREEGPKLLRLAAGCLRDALLLQVGAKKELIINVDCQEILQRLKSELSANQLEAALQATQRALYLYRRNVNPKFIWSSFFLNFGLRV